MTEPESNSRKAEEAAIEAQRTASFEKTNVAPTATPGPRLPNMKAIYACLAMPARIAGIAAVVGILIGTFVNSYVASQRQQQSAKTIREEIAVMEQALKAQPPVSVPVASSALIAPVVPAANQPDSPDDYARFLARGNDFMSKGKYAAAIVEYASAIKSCPSFKLGDEAQYRLGACLLKMGESDQARQSFNAVLTHFSDSSYAPAALYELASMLMSEGRHAQARRLLYRMLLLKDSTNIENAACFDSAYYAIARCYESEADALTPAPPAAMPPVSVAAHTSAKTE